ncbi:uncharacterized protein LOC123225882 isoform X2 [Mangifera indica]|nr:uncharacterized protein LOC123225882 isoform X2 [Mangifera indica]
MYYQQSQFEEMAFWQSLQKQQNNISLPGSFHSEPPQQHLRFDEPLKSSHKQHMEPPWSNHSQSEQKHPNFTEFPLKIGDLHSQEVPHAISPASHESPSQRLVLPDLRINEGKSVSQKSSSFTGGQYFPGRASYKGKEKVTSFSTTVENLTSSMNQQLAPELSRTRGPSNALYSASSELEFTHQTRPMRSDITSDIGTEDSARNSLRELMEVLKECSPPGPDIADSYGDSIGPLFDIPYFSRVTWSSGVPNPASSLKNFKGLYSRKGKPVLNSNKRRRL